MSRWATASTISLRDARVVEDHFDDDHATQQVRQAQRHRVGDRPDGVGQRVEQAPCVAARRALQAHHLDVGRARAGRSPLRASCAASAPRSRCPRLSTGSANECSISPGEDETSSRRDSAGSHCSCTGEDEHGERGDEELRHATPRRPRSCWSMRSNVEPRHNAQRMPSAERDRHGEMRSSLPASSSEFGRRLAIASRDRACR